MKKGGREVEAGEELGGRNRAEKTTVQKIESRKKKRPVDAASPLCILIPTDS